MTVVLDSLAKVNLYLHVTGRRPNGYHELDSLIAFVQTGDRLTFEAASDELVLETTGPMAPFIDGPDDVNLVLKAARGLRDLCGVSTGAKITLEKNLPVAAGIGGGSGDAAAALKGLCRLWGVFPDPEGMHDLALSLGADVPICMKSHAAHVGGIGEVITPLAPLPDCWMVLVNPMVALSTPTVFKARQGDFTPARPLLEAQTHEVLFSELESRHNDLESAACTFRPEIREVLAALSGSPDCKLARMSGSGATCFALFETENAAKSAMEGIKKAHPQWWSAFGKII